MGHDFLTHTRIILHVFKAEVIVVYLIEHN